MTRPQLHSEIAQLLDRLHDSDASNDTILRELVNYVDEKLTGKQKEIDRLEEIISQTKHII